MDGKAFGKSVVLMILLVASSVFFGWACRQMQGGYAKIFSLNKDLLLMLVWMIVAALLVIIFAGLTAAFVRSRWLACLYFVLSAAAALFTWGFSVLAIGASVVYLVLAVIYVFSIAGQLQNQVAFSLRAVTSQQGLIQTGLIVMIAMSFVLGIQGDLKLSDSILPVEIKDSVLEIATPIMQSQLEQLGAPNTTTDSLSAMAQSTMDQAWAQIEQALKPFAAIIPYLGGTLIFGLVEILFILVSWLPGLIEQLLIGFFKMIGFIREEKQLREVVTLQL